jgi:hypothetical protein
VSGLAIKKDWSNGGVLQVSCFSTNHINQNKDEGDNDDDNDDNRNIINICVITRKSAPVLLLSFF